MAKVKLIDVAERAGVSKSTASQYLSGRFDYMSESTKERIKVAVAELNYVPNSIARSLKTNKTKTIGVIVRDITGYYTSRAIRGIDDYCKSNDYNVLIYNTDFDSEIEKKSLQAMSQLGVDGIVIAPSGNNTQLIEDYETKGLPIVQFQLEHDDRAKNIIISDYKKAAFDATEYLIELGHKQICFVTQDYTDVKSREERYIGYAEALAKHGLSADPKMVLHWQREQGFINCPLRLLKEPDAPTAFFTQHLAITTDLLSLFNKHKVAIPDDVSFIGFDEVPMAEFFKVPISVVKQEAYEVGQQAAELLLAHVNNPTQPPRKITIPCTLKLRDSCSRITS